MRTTAIPSLWSPQERAGNLADANVAALKDYLPDSVIIIPGHGKTGGMELLDYTAELLVGKE